MRITPRTALVAVVTACFLSLSVGAVGAAAKPKAKPVTTRGQERAQNRSIKATARALKTTNANVAKDNATLTGVSKALTALQGTVASTITTATTALGKLQTGLETLSSAVTNTTTGLPGLNNARPLVGAVVSNAKVTGSEFTLVNHTPNQYLLSFVNGAGTATDVSQRVYEVTGANPTQVTTTFTAENCSNALITPLCTAVNGGADAKATDVVVTASAADADFQIAAISG